MKADGNLCICDECGKVYKIQINASCTYCDDCLSKVYKKENKKILEWFKIINRKRRQRMARKKFKLGCTARDTITGFEGIVIGVTEWLNGCVRYGIQPQELKDGKIIEANWFDSEQIELVKKTKKKAAKPAGGPMPDPKY